MPLSYFSRIFPLLQERIRQDVSSALPLNNDSLRHCLDTMLSCAPGEEGSLTNDPAFEAMYGWKQADLSIADLAQGVSWTNAWLAASTSRPRNCGRITNSHPFAGLTHTSLKRGKLFAERNLPLQSSAAAQDQGKRNAS